MCRMVCRGLTTEAGTATPATTVWTSWRPISAVRRLMRRLMPKFNMPVWVLCMSWCADFEVPVADVDQTRRSALSARCAAHGEHGTAAVQGSKDLVVELGWSSRSSQARSSLSRTDISFHCLSPLVTGFSCLTS